MSIKNSITRSIEELDYYAFYYPEDTIEAAKAHIKRNGKLSSTNLCKVAEVIINEFKTLFGN